MFITTKRMENIGSDIRGKNFWAALELEKQGHKILKLNTGNPAAFGFKTPESVKKALIENVDRALGYSDVRGMTDARESIMEYHKNQGVKNFTLDNIFIGNGVSEIASMICSALFETGDEILLPVPCYSLWTNEVLLSDATPVLYRCDEENGWNPDVEHIKSLITPNTKAILLINPNNPTGAVYSDKILKEIAQIARTNNLLLMSDEIYDRLVFDDREYTTMSVFAPDIPVITMNGLSKSHCLCGYRCGWLVVSGPDKERNEISEQLLKIASIRLGANSLMQTIIPAALSDMDYTRSMIAPGGRLYEQRKATFEELDKCDGISYVKNNAGLYVFPKIKKGFEKIKDDKKFAYDLLVDKHVLIVPGSGFLWDTPDHFRIVMLPEADILKKAVGEIVDFIDKL